MTRVKDLRLLAPACITWVAAWTAVAAPDIGIPAWVPALVAWAVAAGLAVALVAVVSLGRGAHSSARRGDRWGAQRGAHWDARWPLGRELVAAALLAAAAAALVAQSAAVAADARAASPLRAAAASAREADVVVELTSAPRELAANAAAHWAAAGRPLVRYRASLVGVDGEHATRVPVSVVGPAHPGLVFGASAAFSARVDAAPAAEAAAYRLRPAGEVTVTPPAGPFAWAADLRAGFATAAARLGGDGGALVPGLAIGDTSAVGAQLDADLKIASLTHLTAVSGANCAIVTALAFALAAACGAPRTVRVLAALAALGGFVLLVTPESSVVRAGESRPSRSPSSCS